MVHDLKIWSPWFEAVKQGIKNFELRKDDRPFKEGDILLLREVEKTHDTMQYTGRSVRRMITYITRGCSDCSDWGLHEGYCILSFRPVDA